MIGYAFYSTFALTEKDKLMLKRYFYWLCFLQSPSQRNFLLQ
ncbi:hypothetical protein EC970003_0812 [Escherichia coli 97.0003]|nr:hypothetical protein EC970003_0812 [Escherichia coli 97.0003]